MTLADDIAADLAANHYDTDEHALSVSYNGSTVPALVHYEGHLDTVRGALAQHAVLQVRKADVAAWSRRDPVVIGSDTWYVRGVKEATAHELWLYLTRDERPAF